jgi:hypothetical protein
MVSSIRSRGPWSVLSSWTRLWRASASDSSSACSPSSTATCAAASTVQLSTNTATTSSSDRSASSSRPTLHSTVARRVRCRWGMSIVPAPSASSDRASRPSSAAGSSSRMRAAASSMASGRPSSRRHSSTTAAALPWVSVKSWRTAWARPTNSATAGEDASSSSGTPAASAASSSGSGGTGYSRSARSPSTVRLVARIAVPGQRASSSSRSRAASMTCSRLSRTSSQRPSPSCSAKASSRDPAPPSSAPTARAMPPTTSSGRVTPRQRHEHCARSEAASYALGHRHRQAGLADPTRPGEGHQPHLGPPQQPASSSMARSRPTSEVVATGSERGPRALAGAGAAWGLVAVNRSLSSAARSSRTSRPARQGCGISGRRPRS